MEISAKSSITTSGIFERAGIILPLMRLRRNAPNNVKILFLSFVEELHFLPIFGVIPRVVFAKQCRSTISFSTYCCICVIIVGKAAYPPDKEFA